MGRLNGSSSDNPVESKKQMLQNFQKILKLTIASIVQEDGGKRIAKLKTSAIYQQATTSKCSSEKT